MRPLSLRERVRERGSMKISYPLILPFSRREKELSVYTHSQ